MHPKNFLVEMLSILFPRFSLFLTHRVFAFELCKPFTIKFLHTKYMMRDGGTFGKDTVYLAGWEENAEPNSPTRNSM